jgi:hypothetical protein
VNGQKEKALEKTRIGLDLAGNNFKIIQLSLNLYDMMEEK